MPCYCSCHLPLTLQADEIERILCKKFMNFIMQRAEHFFILRRKPVEVCVYVCVSVCLSMCTLVGMYASSVI